MCLRNIIYHAIPNIVIRPTYSVGTVGYETCACSEIEEKTQFGDSRFEYPESWCQGRLASKKNFFFKEIKSKMILFE